MMPKGVYERKVYEIINCKQCGKKTERKTSNTKYCSHECRFFLTKGVPTSQYKRDYYLKNKKELNRKNILRYQKNRNKYLKRAKEYNRTPAGRFYYMKKRGKKCSISKEQFITWFNSQKKNCCYCGVKFVKYGDIRFSPSIDRIDNSKGYHIDNICLCCYRCNMIKKDWFTFQEMKMIGELLIKKWDRGRGKTTFFNAGNGGN